MGLTLTLYNKKEKKKEIKKNFFYLVVKFRDTTTPLLV